MSKSCLSKGNLCKLRGFVIVPWYFSVKCSWTLPNSFSSSEFDVSKLLGSSRGNTSPLFENASKIALQIFNNLKH